MAMVQLFKEDEYYFVEQNCGSFSVLLQDFFHFSIKIEGRTFYFDTFGSLDAIPFFENMQRNSLPFADFGDTWYSYLAGQWSVYEKPDAPYTQREFGNTGIKGKLIFTLSQTDIDTFVLPFLKTYQHLGRKFGLDDEHVKMKYEELCQSFGQNL